MRTGGAAPDDGFGAQEHSSLRPLCGEAAVTRLRVWSHTVRLRRSPGPGSQPSTADVGRRASGSKSSGVVPGGTSSCAAAPPELQRTQAYDNAVGV